MEAPECHIYKDCWKLSEVGNRQERVLPEYRSKEDLGLLTPPFWTAGVQNHERINFYCFEPPGLQYFVTADRRS